MRRPTPRAHVLLALLAALGGWSPAPAQQPGTGLGVKAGPAEVTLSGWMQAQFNTTTAAGEAPTAWQVRRLRLDLRARVGPLLSGRFQPDLSGGRVTVKDAYLQLSLSPALQLWAGQAHRPFSMLSQYNMRAMAPAEKGTDIRGVKAWDEFNFVRRLGYGERDVGLQLRGAPRGAPLGLSYAAGVFEGPLGADAAAHGTYQLVGRVSVRPARKLSLGAAWSDRDFLEAAPDGERARLRRGNAYLLDFGYGAALPGPNVLVEVVRGDLDPLTSSAFHGAQSWLSYRLTLPSHAVSTVEPLLRVSYGDAQGAEHARGGTLLTPGVNLYFGGVNRVMLDYDVWSPAGAPRAERSLKATLQLGF